jgi:hypothetical protein
MSFIKDKNRRKLEAFEWEQSWTPFLVYHVSLYLSILAIEVKKEKKKEEKKKRHVLSFVNPVCAYYSTTRIKFLDTISI